jgi:hypothetical protein
MTKNTSGSQIVELDALLSEGSALHRALAEVPNAPAGEPRQGVQAEQIAAARNWMEREESFRLREQLKLGLREMEHFEEVAYLQSHTAPGPDWQRLLVLKLEFRLDRLSKLRKLALA